MVDSRQLVEDAKLKWQNSKITQVADISFAVLDYNLKLMLDLEWKINLTKKTVSKNKLIKRLKEIQNKVDIFIYNSNKQDIFEAMEKEVSIKISEAIEKSLADFTEVDTMNMNNTDKFKFYTGGY